MTNAHTPGPWHVNAQLKGRIVGAADAAAYDKMTVNSANHTVATIYHRNDAALIAAAPDLLAEAEANARFLDQLAAHLEANGMPGQAGNCTIRAKATRAAMAKAEGRS